MAVVFVRVLCGLGLMMHFQLLLRSQRVYVDLLQAELFSSRAGAAALDVSVYVQAFNEG